MPIIPYIFKRQEPERLAASCSYYFWKRTKSYGDNRIILPLSFMQYFKAPEKNMYSPFLATLISNSFWFLFQASSLVRHQPHVQSFLWQAYRCLKPKRDKKEINKQTWPSVSNHHESHYKFQRDENRRPLWRGGD